jgi:hypothetical protein
MSSGHEGQRAGFTTLNDETAADMRIVVRSAEALGAGRADRVLAKPRSSTHHAPPATVAGDRAGHG